MSSQSPRSIRKLLVANRGEIAVRILDAARELDIETFAIYAENDASHTYNAAHSIKIQSHDSYNDITQLIRIVKQHSIDAVHPGYGFLSESVDLAKRVSSETGAFVIGPGTDILAETADKLHARRLAERCHVPTLPALLTPTDDVNHVRDFAREAGYPIMIKAVDGGGGRGIRLVSKEDDLSRLMARAVQESPSKQVFAEKAALDGFRHIEVQIIGDMHGNLTHVFERDCSVQRRYQKVVEMAPSLIEDREFVSKIIGSALEMAKMIGYVSFGTFEFLANPQSQEFFFLEVNPRLQVEHTVTESVALVDLVHIQLRIAQGATIHEAGLPASTPANSAPPLLHSLQLRLTAEDVSKDWALSIGKIQSFHFPTGNGIRVDTHLVQGVPAIISSDYDSLVAKIIVTASTWTEVLRKARRALEDTRIVGTETNLHMLKAIISHNDYASGRCDTSWLERNQAALLKSAKQSSQEQQQASSTLFTSKPTATVAAISSLGSATTFRKGDAWSMTLEPQSSATASQSKQQQDQQQQQHLEITRVLRNDFPTTFSANISLTSRNASPKAYTIHFETTSASAAALSSSHRRGNPKDPTHTIIPFPGRLVEVLVDVGDVVAKGDVICVVKQMKMELEVRAARKGTVSWVLEVEDGEDVAEGVLAAVVEEEGKVGAKL